METDRLLLSLVEAMEGVFDFTLDLKALEGKMVHLESVIEKVFQQIAECGIFIREYVGRGFASE